MSPEGPTFSVGCLHAWTGLIHFVHGPETIDVFQYIVYAFYNYTRRRYFLWKQMRFLKTHFWKAAGKALITKWNDEPNGGLRKILYLYYTGIVFIPSTLFFMYIKRKQATAGWDKDQCWMYYLALVRCSLIRKKLIH